MNFIYKKKTLVSKLPGLQVCVYKEEKKDEGFS